MNNDDFYNKTPKKDSDEIKNLIYVLLFFLLISLFGKYLSGLFDKYIVDQIIHTIYKEKLNLVQTLLTFLLTFYGLYFVVVKLAQTRYIASCNFLSLVALVLYLYANERFFNNKYTFTEIVNFDKSVGPKFLDFPYFVLAIALLILIANRIKDGKPNYDNDLVIDLPMSLIEQDRFERKQVYQSLIQQISKVDFKESRSFSIGVVNKWAEGKTSFLNLLSEELSRDKDTILVKFNAWFTSQSDNLTNDFFKTLDDELSNYIYTGSLIRRYANNLTQINSVYNLTKYLPKVWINEDSNLQYFENIEKLLIRLNKRIFVIIDDIDRLDNKELFNVFRMMRNSANFPYLIFLVPFDKEYAINALAENKIYQPKEYLKKIFDVEISLTPIFEGYLQPIFHGIIKEYIEGKLIDSTKDDVKKLIEQLDGIFTNIGLVNFNKPKYSTIKSVLFKIIRNNRDIIRFTNSIKLSLKHNFNKLYFPDVLILELIKYENLSIYRQLFENKDYLNVTTKEDRKVLELYDGAEKGEAFSFLETITDKFDILKQLDGDKELDTNIVSLIESLFAEPEKDDFNAKLSIYYDVNYLNYIQFNVGGISYDEIENLLNGEDEN